MWSRMIAFLTQTFVVCTFTAAMACNNPDIDGDNNDTTSGNSSSSSNHNNGTSSSSSSGHDDKTKTVCVIPVNGVHDGDDWGMFALDDTEGLHQWWIDGEEPLVTGVGVHEECVTVTWDSGHDIKWNGLNHTGINDWWDGVPLDGINLNDYAVHGCEEQGNAVAFEDHKCIEWEIWIGSTLVKSFAPDSWDAQTIW